MSNPTKTKTKTKKQKKGVAYSQDSWLIWQWTKSEQIDLRAKQPSQMACVSEDLKCWGTWDTTCGRKAKDITPSIAWTREVWREIFLERTREGHRQSDEHWNCFKGNVREIPERRGGTHTQISERTDTVLNSTELISYQFKSFPNTQPCRYPDGMVQSSVEPRLIRRGSDSDRYRNR